MAEPRQPTPLSISIDVFKQRYAKRIAETSFQRVHRLAEESKRAKWKAYESLTRNQLFDSMIDEEPHVVLGPQDSHAAARSTLNGALLAQVLVILRSTEILAMMHALGVFKFDDELPVVRKQSVRHLRWCIVCEKFRSPKLFATDHRNPSGLAFSCKGCRDKGEHSVFRRSTYVPKPIRNKRGVYAVQRSALPVMPMQ